MKNVKEERLETVAPAAAESDKVVRLEAIPPDPKLEGIRRPMQAAGQAVAATPLGSVLDQAPGESHVYSNRPLPGALQAP